MNCCQKKKTTFKKKFKPVRWKGGNEQENNRLPIRTTLMAVGLFIFGVIFIITGFIVWWQWGTFDAIPFWTLGGITFIPGSYASGVILWTYMGYKGYRYDQIPSYDD